MWVADHGVVELAQQTGQIGRNGHQLMERGWFYEFEGHCLPGRLREEGRVAGANGLHNLQSWSSDEQEVSKA